MFVRIIWILNKIWNYVLLFLIMFFKDYSKRKDKLLKHILLPNINFRQTDNKK